MSKTVRALTVRGNYHAERYTISERVDEPALHSKTCGENQYLPKHISNLAR